MSSRQQLNILIACGGSGGHLIPGLVVRRELVERGHNVLLSVSDKEIDKKILDQNRLSADLILPANRSGGPAPLRAVRLVSGLVSGTLKAGEFLKKKRINFVLGMGGFNCAPPLLAAGFQHVPRAIHDSNVIPGRATRLFAKSLDVLFLAFTECANHLPSARSTKIVGIPTRYNAQNIELDLPALRKKYRLENTKKTLLVLGGSQGSEFLNKLLSDAAPLLAVQRDKIQILHITGKPEPINGSHPLGAAGIHRVYFEYHNDMDELYSLADIVIARSGSGVIAEVLEFGLKTIFIPLPTAADDHQLHNAKAVETQNHIEILPQKSATPQRLIETLNRLLSAEDSGAKRKKKNAARPEVLIADVLETLAQGGRP